MGVLLENLHIIRFFPIRACEQDVINTSSRIMDPMDFAEATRAKAVMTFHLHDLCDSWHISKDEDEKGLE